LTSKRFRAGSAAARRSPRRGHHENRRQPRPHDHDTVVPVRPYHHGRAAAHDERLPTRCRAMTVRVYNNSKIPDLAMTARRNFRKRRVQRGAGGQLPAGHPAAQRGVLSSAPGEQAVATQWRTNQHGRHSHEFPGIESASPGVIVIVTKDFRPGSSPVRPRRRPGTASSPGPATGDGSPCRGQVRPR